MPIGNRLSVPNHHDCTRCDGSGYLPQYKHVDNGVCYNCRGSGRSTWRELHQITLTAEQLADKCESDLELVREVATACKVSLAIKRETGVLSARYRNHEVFAVYP